MGKEKRTCNLFSSFHRPKGEYSGLWVHTQISTNIIFFFPLPSLSLEDEEKKKKSYPLPLYLLGLLFSQIFRKKRFGLGIQSLFGKCSYPPLKSLVRVLQICPNPGFDIRDIWPLIPYWPPDRHQLRKSNPETHVIHILINNQVIRRGRDSGIFEQLEKRYAGISPTLFVLFREGGRGGESFGERDDGGLAVERADQFFGRWQDDIKVNGNEDAFRERRGL